jgi:polysaccharide export outer membrane protein
MMLKFSGQLLTAGALVSACVLLTPSTSSAQASQPGGPAPGATPTLVTPADYVIGPGDILEVRFWRDPDMTSTVVVRPDGRVSLPLLNDIQAAGLAVEAFRASVQANAAKNVFLTEPTVGVIVKEIHSRQVFITGNVANPGTFPLGNRLNVLQLIALAGGLGEYADKGKISVIRQEGSRQVQFKFNHDDIARGRNLDQNIELRPGDTVLVP